MTNPPESQIDDAAASADGILRCLRMLADEAATLHLAATLDALRTAIAVCAAESDPLNPRMGAPDGVVVH